MYYVLFTKIEQGANTASETFFKKDVLNFLVKILEKYTHKEFLKIPFYTWTSSQTFFKHFDHNYYNNNLKYAANSTLVSITPVTVNTKSELFLKDIFSKFKDIGK